MKSLLFTITILICTSFILCAQMPADSLKQLNLLPHDLISTQNDSVTVPDEKKKEQCVYHVKPLIDIPICIAEGAGALIGLSLLNKKKSRDVNDILHLDPKNPLPITIVLLFTTTILQCEALAICFFMEV